MGNQLTEYKVLVHAGPDDRLRELAELLVDVTWQAGHCARSVRCEPGRSDNELIAKCMPASDIFVSISQSPSESVRGACSAAVATEKAVVALVLDPHPAEDFTRLERIVAQALECGSVRHVVPESSLVARDYLIELHQIVRRLDRRRTSSDVVENLTLRIGSSGVLRPSLTNGEYSINAASKIRFLSEVQRGFSWTVTFHC